MHNIDAHRFTEIRNENGHIKEILSTKKSFKDYCFAVQTQNGEKVLSCRFLNEVVYGFATIESTANQMIEFACKSSDNLEVAVEIPSEPPQMPKFRFIETLEDAEKLLTEYEELKNNGYVVMPQPLLEQIVNEYEEIIKAREKRVGGNID